MTPRETPPSAWTEHAPFAFWLVETLRPRTLVELGTHGGYSYFAFCQAVRRFGTGTACHAIDTWRGDDHAGFYDESVFEAVTSTNRPYEDFSHLHRSTFAEALDGFEDGTIDILHIDGRHGYADVREDYEAWLPKLAENGVVLFHDTQVRQKDFGVRYYFGELKPHHPHVDFRHGHGLGVIAPKGVPTDLRALFDEAGAPPTRELAIGLYRTLGDRVAHLLAERAGAQRDASTLSAADLAEVEMLIAWLRGAIQGQPDDRLAGQLHTLIGWALQMRARLPEDERMKAESAIVDPSVEASDIPPQGRPSKDWKDRRRRARNRLLGSWRLIEKEGVVRGLARIPGDWRHMGRIDGRYAEWIATCDELSLADRKRLRARLKGLPSRPLISVIMPVFDTPETILRDAIASVQAQIYKDWELCIANDASSEPHVRVILDEAARADDRIRVVHRATNGNIAAASNTALDLARGEWIALMDHDDLLPEKALATVALTIAQSPDADILYSDEDKVDQRGRRFDPYFKPKFNIEQMLSQNLVNHLGVYRAKLLHDIGGFRVGFEGSQDYDLALRCLSRSSPERVLHIPQILYHWRQESGTASFSEAHLDRCVDAAERTVQEYLETAGDVAGEGGSVRRHASVRGFLQPRWAVPDPEPLVSIIIPTRDAGDLVEQCVRGIVERTRYANLEILIIDNGSTDPASLAVFEMLNADERVRVVRDPSEFNYSALNNRAAREARGDLLLLLNNDIDVLAPDWLGVMVGQASRPGVGAVGAKLLYADERVQHAGVRLGAGTFDGGPGVAGHFAHKRRRNDPGYFGAYALTREVSAVTGACMMLKREAFESVCGLDEELKVAFNDIDLCLRLRERGWRIIYAADAVLFHLESATRGVDTAPGKRDRFGREVRFMRERWGETLQNDPFYSRHFDYRSADFVLDPRCGPAVDDAPRVPVRRTGAAS